VTNSFHEEGEASVRIKMMNLPLNLVEFEEPVGPHGKITLLLCSQFLKKMGILIPTSCSCEGDNICGSIGPNV
jgi:hypothetical protein